MILVVDDHNDTRYVLERLLKSYGYQAVGVCCGRDALAILKTHAIHLVILDFNMPDMNGLDVLREMREDPRLVAVKTIMFSCHDGDLRDEALAAGIDAYVMKGSLDWDTLRKEIARLAGPGAASPANVSEHPSAKLKTSGGSA